MPIRSLTPSIVRAYLDAQRARAVRRAVWTAAPILVLLLAVAQRLDGLFAATAVAEQSLFAGAVAAGAAIAERRAVRRLLMAVSEQRVF